jgi:hypothetical protein
MGTQLEKPSVFDLALAAANKKGPKFPAALVLPGIQETISEVATILKQPRRSPLEAFASLAMLRIVLDHTETSSPEVIRAAARLTLTEAHIFRVYANSGRVTALDQKEYLVKASNLIGQFIESTPLSPNDRTNLKLEEVDCRLDICELLRKVLDVEHRKRNPWQPDLYFRLRKEVFAILEILEQEKEPCKRFQPARTLAIEHRVNLYCARHTINAPAKTPHTRKLAIEQNLSLLTSDLFKNSYELLGALQSESHLYGLSELLSAAYIGQHAFLGQFTPLIVARYIRQALGKHGRVIALNVPYLDTGGRAICGDFDIVFEVTEAGNTVGLARKVYCGEIKTLLNNPKQILGRNSSQSKDHHKQIRLVDEARLRMVAKGFPKNSAVIAIDFIPDETIRTHSKGQLATGVPQLTIRTPLLGGSAKKVPPPTIAKAQLEEWSKELISTEGLIRKCL